MSIADVLAATFAPTAAPASAWQDPYSQPEYGTVVVDETRNGYRLQVCYDAVCRDFIGMVNGEHVGSFYQYQRQAYDVASREISYLIEQAARYGNSKESDMAISATEAVFTVEGSDLEKARQTLIDLESSLQVAADQKESAYQANQAAAESLEMVEAQIVKQINEATDEKGKKLYSNDTLRDAQLTEWRNAEGYELTQQARQAADAYRITRQNYDLALEHVKTYRALLEHHKSEMERDTERLRAARAQLEYDTAKMQRDTALGVPF